VIEMQVKENKSLHASEVVQVPEGETQVVLTLPEAVPQGKVLNLRVEVSGRYEDAPPPA
jgi:hypothetical protein